MTALAAGATAPAPIRWDCPLNGAGRWVDDKNWVFSLSATPQANTTCAISLMPGLKDLKGDVLPAARFAFRTGAPSIVRSWPFDSSQVDEDQVFALQFNTVLASTPKVYCQSSAWPEQLLMQPIAAEARRRLLAHLANDEGLAPKDADRVAEAAGEASVRALKWAGRKALKRTMGLSKVLRARLAGGGG